jgi:hypothetical protein
LRALALVLAILAALAAAAGFLLPRVVDADAVRARLVAELQTATGTPISVRGAAELRLLPRPVLSIGRVAIGQPGGDGPALDVDRVDLVLHPAPLLAGRSEIESVRLVRPRIAAPRPAADLAGLLGAAAADRTALAWLEVVDGQLTLGSGPDRDVNQVSLVLERDPGGGFSASGRGRWQGQEVRLDTKGRLTGPGRPLPIEATLAVGAGNTLRFTGSLTALDGTLATEGTVALEAIDAAAPLRLLLAGGGLALPTEAPALGPAVAEGRIQSDATGWRLSLTRLTGPGTDLAVEASSVHGAVRLAVSGARLRLPDKAPETLRRAVPALLAAAVEGTIELRLAELRWRERSVSDVRLATRLLGAAGTAIDRASARLPGNAEIALSGRIEAVDGRPLLRGEVSLAAPELPALLGGLGLPTPSVEPDRLRRLTAAAGLEASIDRVALRELDLRLDGSRVQGSLAAAVGGARPQFAADLAVDRLTLDGYLPGDDPRPLGEALRALAEAADMAVDLELGSLAWHGTRIEGVRLEAELVERLLTLRRLSAGAAGEAEVNLAGTVALAAGEVSLALDARLERPARLLRLAGLDLPAALLRLAPLRVDGTVRSDGGDYAVELAAALPGLVVDATTRLPRDLASRPERLQLDARAESFTELLARLGLPGRTGPGLAGPARLALDLARTVAGVAGDLDLRLGPSELRGRIAADGPNGRPRLDGALTIPQLAPELVLLALEVAELALDAPPGPPSRWPGAWPRQPLDWRWLGRADIALALDWPLADGQGTGRIELADDTLELLASGAPIAGGEVSGRVVLQQRGDTARLEVAGRLGGAQAQRLLPLIGLRDGVEGLVEFTVAAAGTGRSIADLVGGLAGDGRLELRGGRVAGLRLAPLADILLAPDLPIERLAGAFSVARGVIAADGLRLASPAAGARIDLRLDLLAWILEAVVRPDDPALPVLRLLGPPGRIRTLPPATE